MYLDSDVLTATKVLAAARERSESRIVEDALRAYVRTDDVDAATADLRALMQRVAARSDHLDDREAMDLAVEETGGCGTSPTPRRQLRTWTRRKRWPIPMCSLRPRSARAARVASTERTCAPRFRRSTRHHPARGGRPQV